MSAIEITLIIIGVIFLIGSFLIKDKLSSKDIDKISQLSEEELKILVEKKLKNVNADIEDIIEEVADSQKEITKRELEKETNSKIMAINEYSDTVLESINKSHNEIMFLYSMLNDKHAELTDLASQLQTFSDNLRKTENELLEKIADAASEIEQTVEQTVEETEKIDENDAFEASVKSSYQGVSDVNHNDSILRLHKLGKNDIEIAKDLGLGLGEVKLVLGLFEGEKKDEA